MQYIFHSCYFLRKISELSNKYNFLGYILGDLHMFVIFYSNNGSKRKQLHEPLIILNTQIEQNISYRVLRSDSHLQNIYW